MIGVLSLLIVGLIFLFIGLWGVEEQTILKKGRLDVVKSVFIIYSLIILAQFFFALTLANPLIEQVYHFTGFIMLIFATSLATPLIVQVYLELKLEKKQKQKRNRV